MFNCHFRKVCGQVIRAVKPIFSAESSLGRTVGCSDLQFTNPVRHFRNQPIRIPKPKRVYYPEMPEEQEVVKDNSVEEMNLTKDIVSKVNTQISEQSHGRLFAIVYIKGNQLKVTEGDLIVVETAWAPEPGDAIRLEKVLLVGSSDFTLLGCPLILPDLVRVTATVTNKTLEATRYYFRYTPRKQMKKSIFNRAPMTTLRINAIEFTGLLDERRDIEGLEGRVL